MSQISNDLNYPPFMSRMGRKAGDDSIKRSTKFVLSLTKEERIMIEKLAIENRTNCSVMIRELVYREYNKKFN